MSCLVLIFLQFYRILSAKNFDVIILDAVWSRPVLALPCVMTIPAVLQDHVVVWFPVAPAGYVAVGCIVTKSQDMPSVDLVRCLRVDLVIPSRLAKPSVWALSSERSPNSVWSMSGARGGYSCSMWRVENQVRDVRVVFLRL
jgi:hypothetical protein